MNTGENAEVKTQEQKEMEAGAPGEPSLDDILRAVQNKGTNISGEAAEKQGVSSEQVREIEDEAAKEMGFDK